MSDTIQIPKANLAKYAALANATAPRLEKLASLEEGLNRFARDAAQGAADAGVIRADSVERVTTDLVSGGFPKISEFVDFLLQRAGTPAPMGKSASRNETPTQKPSANANWDSWVLANVR
jgi:hypothetical protein